MTPLNRKRIEEIRDGCEEPNNRPDGPVVCCEPETLATLCTLALEAERYREALESLIKEICAINLGLEIGEADEAYFQAIKKARAALRPKDSQ